MSETTTSFPAGARLGNYELVRLVASGGMADIYLAKQLGIGNFERLVAVKVLNRARAADPDSCSLFLDEARLLAMLDHTNLACVYTVDRSDGVHYLAMEYVHGVDLREMLATCERENRAVPYEAAIAIVAGAAQGLDHAHRRCGPDGKPLHLVHRDVSLSNIMVGHDGNVKVVDFGIAIASVSSHHTNPGIVRGKASYMSPEQALGDDVDLRTDVFALGVVLYELTTGRRCFQGNSDFERMLAVVRGDFVRPSEVVANFPPALEQVIMTALAVDANKRYSSAHALHEALLRVARAEGWNGDGMAIPAFMHELFGTVSMFGKVATAEITNSAIVEQVVAEEHTPAHHATVLIRRSRELAATHVEATEPHQLVEQPRRLARGTDAEPMPVVRPETVRADNEWHDDEPTRGRRSAPRMFVARYAA